ncbi:unnamed protein product [Spirodela intermedia]|uniref:Tf2-1-like SH3-like domain-containing protein n=1 Tax=Spirodela intermedia TaxID=51605 RepID=A0A7I8JWE5_SPIIN|nr:unnamed protein product [Spirodela intermedia]CAA6673802.1 unnamed protein product [Spirodela intermedia]
MSCPDLLQPLPILEKIWEELSMDFIEGLPLASGFNTILVVVNRLSKYAQFSALKHPFTVGDTLLSDCDRIFLSTFWRELFRLQGTVLHCTSAYHSQTDGKTEVLWCNTTFNSSTGTTPFQAIYGRDPPTLKPFRILDRIGAVAYCLKLPLESRKHRVFHVSQLKPAKGDQHIQPQPLLLNSHATHHTTQGLEVLVEWRDLPTTESTWELAKSILHVFPEFSLVDKVRVLMSYSHQHHFRSNGNLERQPDLKVEMPPLKTREAEDQATEQGLYKNQQNTLKGTARRIESHPLKGSLEPNPLLQIVIPTLLFYFHLSSWYTGS